MGEILLKKKSSSKKFLIRALYVMAIIASCYAFRPTQDDETEREYPPPGAHQIASFLLSQLRPGEFPNRPVNLPILPYSVPETAKRNSAELTSSIMGIPRNMIDNGRK